MKKIIALIFLAALFITACGSAEPVKNAPDQKLNENMTDEGKQAYLEEQKKNSEKYLSIETKAMKKNDADICEQIDYDARKYTCKFNVLSQLASANKDPSLCDKIGREDLVSDCKQNAENIDK